MAELSSYPPVTTLLAAYRVPVVTNPGVAGGNGYITAANMAADPLFAAGFAPASRVLFTQSVLTDQTTVMTTAINVLPATGGRVAIPTGVFYSQITASGHSNLTFSGAGVGATTLVGPTTSVMFALTGTPRGNYTFEDMTIDLGLAIGFMSIYPDDGQVTFRRCRFINATNYIINPAGAIGPVIEDCVFHGGGNPVASAVTCNAGVRGLRWIRSKCLYMLGGITFDATPHDDIDIDGGVFDGGWYLLKTRPGGYTNSGGTVTYSATGLADSAASFGAIPTPFDVNVRALPVLESGAAAATYFNTYVNDTTATFVTALVKPGHIVRVSGKFAVVERVVSETRLYVERWIDSTTYFDTAPPADTTAYTVYRVLLGLVSANTGTTITVDRWLDFHDGASVTPAAGTLYEVLVNHGEYSGVHAAAADSHATGGIRNIRVHGGVHFTRSWNDQLSLFGADCRPVIDKTVLVDHGQDFGITCHGDHARVDASSIHNGGAGIAISGADSVVNAYATGSPYVNDINVDWLGDIIIGGSRTRASGSIAVASGALAKYGIVVLGFAADGVTSDVDLSGTTVYGYSIAERRLVADAAAGVTGTILGDVPGTVSSTNATGTITMAGTYQGIDAELTAIAGLTSAANKGIQFTGSGTAAVFDLTAAGLALLDDAAASDQRTTLGLGNLATATTLTEYICVALSDETTAITTGTAKATFRMPFAMTVTDVRASVNTVSSSGLPTVDINDGGTTILSTKLTIDASEFTSTTAATAAVISDSALADDAEITFDIDVAGTGAKGLKVWIIGTRVV